jgi:hypothetical protein
VQKPITCKINLTDSTARGFNFHECKLGELHEKHVVATGNIGKHISICFVGEEKQENACPDGRSQDLVDAS